MEQSVRQLANGEELVVLGPPPNEVEDPRDRALEMRRLASDDFNQDFDDSLPATTRR